MSFDMYPNPSGYFQLPNPYGSVTKRSKTFERQQENIEKHNSKASMANENKQIALRSIKNWNNVFLLCRLCDSKLVKKKNIKKDIGFGNSIEVECYVCPTDRSKWIGNKPNIHHVDKPDLVAEIVQFSGVQ